MTPPLAELVGTALLLFLGCSVVANVLLTGTKGHGGGWIVITTAWGLAVMAAVYCVGSISGAHLNPAITFGLALIGKFEWSAVPLYLVAQLAGGFLGATLAWLAYLPHWRVTEDAELKRAVFCTAPAIRAPLSNLLCEALGTAVLVFGALAIPRPLAEVEGWASGFGPLLIGLLVFVIGLALGGPTGYAINPARDLGPRLAHALLPIAGKGGSDWGYAWVPIVGPLLGGAAGALLYQLLYEV